MRRAYTPCKKQIREKGERGVRTTDNVQIRVRLSEWLPFPVKYNELNKKYGQTRPTIFQFIGATGVVDADNYPQSKCDNDFFFSPQFHFQDGSGTRVYNDEPYRVEIEK